MIEFTFKDGKFYKDNKLISKSKVENMLNKYQFKNLLEKGKVRVRRSSIKDENTRNEEILEKVKGNYRTDSATYLKTGFVYELYRKHPRFGFWQIVCYLDDLRQDTINQAILKDVKEQALLAKSRRVIDLNDI